MLDTVLQQQGVTTHYGPQKLVFAPPRYGYLELGDPLIVEDALDLIQRLNELLEKHGGLYILVNMRAVKEFSREIRQLAEKAPSGYAAVAIVGTSFPIRVTTSMVLRAARLLKPESMPYPVEFFANEADASSWLAKVEREKHSTQGIPAI